MTSRGPEEETVGWASMRLAIVICITCCSGAALVASLFAVLTARISRVRMLTLNSFMLSSLVLLFLLISVPSLLLALIMHVHVLVLRVY